MAKRERKIIYVYAGWKGLKEPSQLIGILSADAGLTFQRSPPAPPPAAGSAAGVSAPEPLLKGPPGVVYWQEN